jgi:hypothetical protein
MSGSGGISSSQLFSECRSVVDSAPDILDKQVQSMCVEVPPGLHMYFKVDGQAPNGEFDMSRVRSRLGCESCDSMNVSLLIQMASSSSVLCSALGALVC